jgi:hypothetical protein
MIDTTSTNYGDRILYIALIFSFIFLAFIIQLVRRRQLSERFALAWLLLPVLSIVFSSNRGLLDWMAGLLGIYYPPAIMIPILVGLFILLSLYFTIKMSKAELQIKTLTQELGLLKYTVKKNGTSTSENQTLADE